MKKYLPLFVLSILTICLCFSLSSCGITVSVEYSLDGGELPEGAPVEFKSGKAPDFSTIVPTKENYVFDGWYTDKDLTNAFDANTYSEESVKLYAKWSGEEFDIEYVLNGGTCEGMPEKHVFGKITSVSQYVPEKAGYVFLGWCYDEELEQLVTNIPGDVCEDLTLYAKYNLAPEKTAQIANVTKGVFGSDYNVITLDVSEYVNAHGLSLDYSVTSSNEDVVKASIKGTLLTLKFLDDEGSSNITLTASYSEKINLTFNFSAAPKKYQKIACIGDSLTAREPAYPTYLSEYISVNGIQIGNFGRSGASLSDYTNNDKYGSYTEWAKEKYEASIAFDADLIIIMLGTNDATKIVDGAPKYDWDIVAPAYKSDYIELINSYKTACPNADIVLMTSPAVRAQNSLSISNDILENYTYPLQLEVAKETGVKLVDLRKHLDAPLYSTSDIYDDNVHFNETGAKEIAEFVLKSI